MKCLEAQHLPSNSLDKTVIRVKGVVKILNLQDFSRLAETRNFKDYLQLVIPPDWSRFYQ